MDGHGALVAFVHIDRVYKNQNNNKKACNFFEKKIKQNKHKFKNKQKN